MEAYSIIALLVGLMLVLLALGIWVGITLLMVALVAFVFFADVPVGEVLPTALWSTTANWPLTSLPLFIWMGEILFRTRLAEDMFRGLLPWVSAIPGRLLHVNILACGIFAAVSGSSAATAATIGQMTLPELKRRHYPEQIAMGSLAAGGTLGILIPPSIPMIVYGISAQVSIAKLFVAGVLPGIVLIAAFMAYTAGWSLINRDRMPSREPASTWRERLSSSRRLVPILLLIACVIGSIYSGIATPTEASAVGVLGSLIVAAATGSLTRRSLLDSLKGTMKMTCMIIFILASASFLSTALAFLKLPATLATYVVSLQLSPNLLLLALALLFVLLGCFIDGISMVVLTAAIILPIVERVGINLLWFGIFLIVMVEMANITPPVGFNLFVIQGITGRDSLQVARGALPYFLIMCFFTVLITAFPSIVLTLPNLAFK